MVTIRTLAAALTLLLSSGTNGSTTTPFVPRQNVSQGPEATPLSCEPGAVSVDVSRSPGVRFERIEQPSGAFANPREFTFAQGPIRRVRLFLSASLPEGGVGRGSEAKLEVLAQTSPSATDATAEVTWWRLVQAPTASSLENAAETLLLDAKTLAPCFNGDPCRFADVDPASDSATALLILGFTRDLGGANANNWEHARLVLDFREGTPRVAVAADCAYNEGGGACTAFDSGQMPRSELSCPWDATASDFACTETSDELGHRDFQLLSGRSSGSREGEVASLEVAARRLADRPRGSVEIVTGLGRVRHVHDVRLGARHIMVLADHRQFDLIERTAAGIGAIHTIRPQPLVPPADSSDVVATAAGWTNPANPLFRTGEIFRDAQMVVLRIVEASQYDTTAAPSPTAMYWLAIQLRGADLTSAALTVVDPGSYGGCGRQAVAEVITAVARIGRPFDAVVTVQPPTSITPDEKLSWGSSYPDEKATDCRRPGRVRWRDGKFDVLISDRACRASQPPRFVILGLDGSIRLSDKFP